VCLVDALPPFLMRAHCTHDQAGAYVRERGRERERERKREGEMGEKNCCHIASRVIEGERSNRPTSAYILQAHEGDEEGA
jgi:hypothetical protein